jgi:hypothetical protein
MRGCFWPTMIAGVAVGVTISVVTPVVVREVRDWVGNIVLEAVHQHWMWEQQSNVFKPAILQELN